MVWRVCSARDVDDSGPRTQMSPSISRMAVKPLSRLCFGHWRPLGYVFLLTLLLLCHPVTSLAPPGPGPNTTTLSAPRQLLASQTLLSTKTITQPLATNISSNISSPTPVTPITESHSTTVNQTYTITSHPPPQNSSVSETTIITNTSTAVTPTSSLPSNTSSETNTTLPTMSTTYDQHLTNGSTPVSTTFYNISTAFTPVSSSPSNTTLLINTTSLPPYTTSNHFVTKDSPPPCNLYQSCNQTFYWMMLSVNGKTGELQSDQDISTWLNEFFRQKFDSCAQVATNTCQPPSVFTTPSSAVGISASSESILTTTQDFTTSASFISASVLTQKPSLFEDMEFSCDPKNFTTGAKCTALMKLSEPANLCCIRDTVMMAGRLSNSSINVTAVESIEKIGLCAESNASFPAMTYETCNQSLKLEDVCSKPLNSSCVNNTSVVPGNQQNCTSCCSCSSYCNNSDAYYRVEISGELSNFSINSALDQILNRSACNSSMQVCRSVQTFISLFRNATSCPSGSKSCQIIVRLNMTMDLCEFSTALEDVIAVWKGLTITEVTRVAVCSWSNDSALDDYRVVKLSLSYSNFCAVPSINNFVNVNSVCANRSDVVVLLTDRCNSLNSTTASPSLTTSNSTTQNFTSISTTTTLNTTGSTTSSEINLDNLLKESENASSLNATQVEKIILNLESAISGPNVSLKTGNTSVRIVGNLLDVPVNVITPFSKRAIGIVDTVGLKLVVSGESESILSTSLALAVKKVDGTRFQETSFSITDSSSLQVKSDSRVKRDVGGETRASSTPLGSITLPALMTQNLTAEQQQIASRVQFNFFQKDTFFQDKALGKSKLNSGILSSSVANLSISGLQRNVVITLRNTYPISGNYVASCVFWDFSKNGGSGGWNSNGCSVLNTSDTETTCACNHLTSFGILLDISKTPIDPVQNTILTYITYIGCGISAIFLSITLLTYLSFGKLRKDIPSKILIQLCLALLLLNLVFLLDAWLALYTNATGLCISTAFFLHFFLLASFTWMAMEAVQMYLALVKVFNTYISRFMIKIGLVGWGIPLIVVIIVIAINKDNYGLVSYGKFDDGASDDFCWIRNDVAFYVAVVGYFCAVFLLNFSMFIVVMVQLYRIKRQNPHNVQHRSGWQELRSVAGLTVLLGLTWGFAFFAWGPVNLAFMYLFAIFNTLQGFFIFVFHCAMKENVRRQWRTYLCCGKLRLAENSEWSRTATQKNKKGSMKRSGSYHSTNSSNNSRSSFLHHDSLASEAPMGISNPIALEETSSDVVMNELNDQHRRSY